MNSNKQFNPTQTNMKKTGGSSYKDETNSINAMSIKDGGLNSSNAASLKGKVASLEDTSNELSNELSGHRSEISNLRNEKDALKDMILNKTEEVRKTLMLELEKMDESIERHIRGQKGESARLQQQILTLKAEKAELSKDLSVLQSRLQDILEQIGNEDIKEI